MESIRLITYNIHHGTNADEKPSLNEIAALLSNLNPGIIALQEVDKNLARSGRQHQASVLAQQLNMNFVFAGALQYPNGEYGNALLSRLPIISCKKHLLPDPVENRCLMEVIVQSPSGPLGIFNVHMSLDAVTREQHLTNFILPRLEACPYPVILMGDFNSTSDRKDIKLLTSRLTDTYIFNEGIITNSFPSSQPVKRIDYILADNHFQVQKYFIVDSRASDHLPVAAEILI
ncbi:MAG: endonuclease/exonuclease/phosphatase family protein [Syntrophomonadaceae bacterium]|jgi:endonuclease/exonuclease/phosphatase family metal-dependent hydrolase